MKITKTNSMVVHTTVYWAFLTGKCEYYNDSGFQKFRNYKGQWKVEEGISFGKLDSKERELHVFTSDEVNPEDFLIESDGDNTTS